MDDINTTPKEENTSNSFAESEEKSIKSNEPSSPINQESDDNNDSEVERSDNDEEDESTNFADKDEESNQLNESIQSKDNEESNQQSIQNEDNNSNEIASSKDAVSEQEESENEDMKVDKSKNKSDNEDSDDELEENELNKSSQHSNESNDDEIAKKKQNDAKDIFGDSDDSDEEEIRHTNKRKHISESSDEDNSDEEIVKKKKKRAVIRDSDSEDSEIEKEQEQEKDDDKQQQSDDDADEDLANKKETNDDNKDDQEVDNQKIVPDLTSSDSSDDELEDDRKKPSHDFMYDFDLMMMKRKEQNARNRRRKNTDIINDSDDFIADLITQMKQAAEDDFELNKERKAATRKMKLLPQVQSYLRKIDLRESFLDSGVLSVMTDWLTPLPDRSLPNLQVRETMLKILLELNIMDVDRLKSSSIGKAVMYLFKHPKETKENKRLAAKLISNWSRPIFNCETDYQSISKEEREERDHSNMAKIRRSSTAEPTQSSSTGASNSQAPVVKPGDKGWVPRARVPMPSTRDYVVRPKSTIDFEITKSTKRPATRLDKHLRNFQEKKRSSKMQRAVKISIEGRKL